MFNNTSTLCLLDLTLHVRPNTDFAVQDVFMLAGSLPNGRTQAQHTLPSCTSFKCEERQTV